MKANFTGFCCVCGMAVYTGDAIEILPPSPNLFTGFGELPQRARHQECVAVKPDVDESELERSRR